MEQRRTTWHRDTTAARAPGDLELVRSFLSLHDHLPGIEDSLPPTGPNVGEWLERTGLIDPGTAVDDDDLAWALEVREALRARVLASVDAPRDHAAIRTLDTAATEVGLHVGFGDHGLRPTAGGVRGAIGQVLAIAFLSELDGSWERFKECSSPTCRAVFYDRSKNRSGRWCSMAECGNRAKVRAYRERERSKS